MIGRGIARLKEFLTPPGHLLARVRWILLLISLGLAVVTVPIVLSAAALWWPIQPVAIVGLIWLCWYWIRGYRRESFPYIFFVPEGLAIFTLALATDRPVLVLAPVYCGLALRSLYGSGRDVLITLLVYLGAFYSASALLLWFGRLDQPLAELLPRAFGLTLMAGILCFLVETFAKQERMMDREKVLWEAGAALVAAEDWESIYTVTLDVALKMTEGNPKVRVSLATGSPEQMIVVASAGERASEIRGKQISPYSLPDHLRSRFLGKQSVGAEHDEAVEMRRALGMRPTARPFFMTPLFIQEELRGTLTAASDSAFPEEVRNGLEALGFQVALALERVTLTEDLRRSEANLAEAQRIAHIGSWEWNVQTNEVYWSDEMYRLYGLAPRELVLTPERILNAIHPEDREYVRESVLTAVYEGKRYDIEHRILLPDGSERIVRSQGEVKFDDAGKPVRMIGTTHDITEHKALERQLIHQAFHDALTGLPNRTSFMNRLEHALARVGRYRETLAVLFLDLENFKVVNDSLGHQMGDRLLVAVAERLSACTRPGDTVARIGGDEFTFLLENLADPSDAVGVAERIVRELQEPFALDGHEMFVTPTIGIALSTPGQEDLPEDLLRNADIALYEAKNRGEARYALYEAGMYSPAYHRLQLESELRRAIDEGQFRVYYQPKVLLETGEIFGVEALVRWEHPERGLVYPEEFVPLAEEVGLIFPLGRRTLEEACRQAREWRDQHPANPSLKMCVNLSVRQVQHSSLARQIAQILRETGLDASSLLLEITESVMMEDGGSTISRLRELKALGVDLVIDDFGTGYSSLSYLKRLPVDYLKIDRSFVGRLGKDPGDTAIVEAIIDLAHDLGLKVIAEGVETRKQLQHLKALGCDLAQGYYFYEPLPAADISEMLVDYSSSPRR